MTVALFACVHSGGRSLAAKVLTEHHAPESVEQADVVVTMGCGETCPVFPGTRYEDWPLDDPKGQELPVVRRIVDEIDARVRDLLDRLG